LRTLGPLLVQRPPGGGEDATARSRDDLADFVFGSFDFGKRLRSPIQLDEPGVDLGWLITDAHEDRARLDFFDRCHFGRGPREDLPLGVQPPSHGGSVFLVPEYTPDAAFEASTQIRDALERPADLGLGNRGKLR